VVFKLFVNLKYIWLNGQIKEYQRWYNEERFHNGVMNFPVQVYT